MATTPTSLERFLAVCAGVDTGSAVRGVSYVDPELVAQVSGWDPGDPAGALAALCDAARLDFAFVAADTPWASRAVDSLLAADRAVVWAVDGLLASAFASLGADAALRATLRSPELLEHIFDERLTRAAEQVEAGLDLGATAVVIGEDLAGSGGPLIAPDFVNAALMPRLAGLARLAVSLDVPALLHTDGDSRAFLPAVSAAGFAGVHAGGGLDMEHFEAVYWSARRAGLLVVGGIPTVELGHGPHAAVRLGHRVGLLAVAGGLMVADDGGLTHHEQVAEWLTVVQTASTGVR